MKILQFFCLIILLSACAQDPYTETRLRMVREQIIAQGIRDSAVIDAMEKVQRHLFVPEEYQPFAYIDGQLDIGAGQTITSPNMVAYMTELLDLSVEDTVLEIGTGSGYQAAILAEIAGKVYTIEIIPELGQAAEKKLRKLGYANVEVRIGDGYNGWPEHAPFDGIIVTAAPDEVPQPLIDQLAEGGRMVIPVGPKSVMQDLLLIEKIDGQIITRNLKAARFTPLTR